MSKYRRGISLIYMCIGMAALCAMLSLAVDLARVQLVKTELQQAADAAARYAATGIKDGTATGKGIAAAGDNRANGSAVVISSSDVQTGNWNSALTPRFSPTRAPLNAVQVVATRSAARQNATPLLFASILGQSTCDATTVSIARIVPKVPLGFIGLQGVHVKNNLVSASYDSSVSTTPNASSYQNSGMLGSNVSITAAQNEVAGLVVLGPGATTSLSLPSPPLVLSDPIPTPVLDFSAAPSSNPGGVSASLVVSGTTTLPSGSYYFTSITFQNNSALRFSGPATLYVDGDVIFIQNGTIAAHNSIPANLVINQRGAGTVFGGDTANNVDVTAVITAPQTDFVAWNGSSLKGAATFRTISAKNNSEFYYDETLQMSLPGQGNAIVLVK